MALGRATWKRISRVVLGSMGVGAAATAVDLAVLAALVSGLGLGPRLASAPALCAGIVAQFAGNKLVAFQDYSRAWVRQGVQFLAVEALGLLANLALYDLAMAWTRLPYLAARLATTSLVYFCLCLPLWSLIFRAVSVPRQASAASEGRP
ncbi:MAG: GtrA family protein [Deltaproteobacteria bacterium]|nr:GtrA family protein [Deltaproteobacteria bacterium]